MRKSTNVLVCLLCPLIWITCNRPSARDDFPGIEPRESDHQGRSMDGGKWPRGLKKKSLRAYDAQRSGFQKRDLPTQGLDRQGHPSGFCSLPEGTCRVRAGAVGVAWEGKEDAKEYERAGVFAVPADLDHL